MSSESDQYAISWNSYSSHLKESFDSLLASQELVDVTLACEGGMLFAHKVVLSACSSYFRQLFKENPCQHPIVVLKDVQYQHMASILKFVYKGEASVPSDSFNLFLKIAEFLKISGLAEREVAEPTPVQEADLELSPVLKRRKTTATDDTVVQKEKPDCKTFVKSRGGKRKINENSPEKSITCNKKLEEIVQQPFELKTEEIEIVHNDQKDPVEDPLDVAELLGDVEDPDSFIKVTDKEPLPIKSKSHQYNEGNDLLSAKMTLGDTKEFHRLEERIGKVEAARSFCRGCFIKVKEKSLTIDKIKKVNTFCPGCPGLPNYCQSCYKKIHKGIKNRKC